MFVYINDLRSELYDFLAADNSVVVGVKTARNAVEVEAEEAGEGEGEAEEGENSEAGSDEKTKENKDS